MITDKTASHFLHFRYFPRGNQWETAHVALQQALTAKPLPLPFLKNPKREALPSDLRPQTSILRLPTSDVQLWTPVSPLVLPPLPFRRHRPNVPNCLPSIACRRSVTTS